MPERDEIFFYKRNRQNFNRNNQKINEDSRKPLDKYFKSKKRKIIQNWS
jgi:hypothetical protein